MKFSGRHFPKDVILTTIRWYLRYKLSYRDIEELIAERGVDVDHSTVNRWVVKYAALLAAQAQHYKRRVGVSWRFDETYIKVRGQKFVVSGNTFIELWISMVIPSTSY